MRSFSTEHAAIVKRANSIGKFCYDNKFEGVMIFKGVSVRMFKSDFCENDSNWLWGMIESIVGGFDFDMKSVFEPAVLLLNMQYKYQKDRGDEMFHKCNQQFLANCIKCAKLRYGFLSPKRYSSIRYAKDVFAKLDATVPSCWKGVA